MKKSVVKSALLGGVIVFVWIMISWMLLPWHKENMKQFANPEEVAKVISYNACDSGVYVLPNMPQKCGVNNQETLMSYNAGRCNANFKPTAMVTVKYEGINYLSYKPYLIAFITQLVAAYIIGWLLSETKGLSYGKKVGFVTLIGLTVGLLGEFPRWIWMGAPFCEVFLCIMDLVVGWFLAGLVLAKYVKTVGAKN